MRAIWLPLEALLNQVVSASKLIPDGVQRAIGNSKGGGGWVARSCFLVSSGARQVFVKSTKGISLHRYIEWVSCETLARTFGIFVADCAEVPKLSAIPYWKALHTRQSTVQKYVFGIAEISLISPRKDDITIGYIFG